MKRYSSGCWCEWRVCLWYPECCTATGGAFRILWRTSWMESSSTSTCTSARWSAASWPRRSGRLRTSWVHRTADRTFPLPQRLAHLISFSLQILDDLLEIDRVTAHFWTPHSCFFFTELFYSEQKSFVMETLICFLRIFCIKEGKKKNKPRLVWFLRVLLPCSHNFNSQVVLDKILSDRIMRKCLLH